MQYIFHKVRTYWVTLRFFIFTSLISHNVNAPLATHKFNQCMVHDCPDIKHYTHINISKIRSLQKKKHDKYMHISITMWMKTISVIHSILYLLCKVEWTDPHTKQKQKQNWHPNPVISFSFDTLTIIYICMNIY